MPTICVGGGHACACVCLSSFYINLYVLFIYENIFTKLSENVYGYENMSLKTFVLIFKKMAAIAIYSKISIML